MPESEATNLSDSIPDGNTDELALSFPSSTETLEDWKPVIQAGIQAYSQTQHVELQRIGVSRMDRQMTHQERMKQLDLLEREQTRTFWLRLAGIVLCAAASGTAFVVGNQALGVSFVTPIVFLALGVTPGRIFSRNSSTKNE